MERRKISDSEGNSIEIIDDDETSVIDLTPEVRKYRRRLSRPPTRSAVTESDCELQKCSCPYCDLESCIKYFQKLYPNNKMNEPPRRHFSGMNIQCLNNLHVPQQTEDDIIARNALKNALNQR